MDWTEAYIPFFPLQADLAERLHSSKGRHLNSFLYPPHGTLRFLHCWQVGLDSSHFRRLTLQVRQPGHGQHSGSVQGSLGRAHQSQSKDTGEIDPTIAAFRLLGLGLSRRWPIPRRLASRRSGSRRTREPAIRATSRRRGGESRSSSGRRGS